MNAALNLMAGLVLEDGRAWGDVAAAFQWEDARAVLDPAGRPYHFLTRSRGGAKTSDLAGLAIATMLAQLGPGSRLYAIAADRDQGRLLVDSVAGYVARTPAIRGALTVENFKVTAPRKGSVLEVLAADAAGAWGLRPSFVVVDEISMWESGRAARSLFEAVTSATAKVTGARMVLLGTAGDPTHWSHKVLQHAERDPLWRVHEVPGPAPWLDPKRLAEQQRRLPESVYRRLFLNEWTAAEDRLVSEEDLRAAVTLDGPVAPQPGKVYAIGLDLGLKHDRTAAVVAHAEPVLRTPEGEVVAETVGTRIVVDRIETWQGSRLMPVLLEDVEQWVAAASGAYNNATIRYDPYQALGSAQRLRVRGIRTEEFTFSASSVGRLASTLHLLLRNRQLALPADDALLSELAQVRLRESSPGVLRMDHDPDKHDDRATALALAASWLLEHDRSSAAGAMASTGYLTPYGDTMGGVQLGGLRDPVTGEDCSF